MYTQDFEDRGGMERAYVSHASQEESDRLFRENEKLKKSLEKEKFFNKLLDQEISELKQELRNREPHPDTFRRGIAPGLFYTLLFFSLLMAGFIAYTLYYDKQYHLFTDLREASSGPQMAGPVAAAETAITPQPAESPEPLTASGAEQPIATATLAGQAESGPDENSSSALTAGADPARANAVQPASREEANSLNPPVQLQATSEIKRIAPGVAAVAARSPSDGAAPAQPRDSVPNIIGRTAAAQTSAAAVQTPAAVPSGQATPPPAAPSRSVIGRYRVVSKANFYQAPDENTMRNSFIRESDDRLVLALEDRNGFIYVEYTNELGTTTRGWLSKKDLIEVKP